MSRALSHRKGSTPSRHHRGFSLIELVVAISVSAIVVAFAAMFIATPVQTYLAQARRAELVDEADAAMRNIASDVRGALPNSVRFSSNGAIVVLEMLAVVDVADYYGKDTHGSSVAHELDTTTPDAEFSNFASFTRTAYPFTSANHFIVVNHLGTAGADAYAMANVIAPLQRIDNAATAAPPLTPPLLTGEDHVKLNAPIQFAAPSPTHHVFLISGPIAYVCDSNAHTLTRYSGYPISVAVGAVGAAAGALIAKDVAACQVDYRLQDSLHNRLVGVQLQFSRAGENLRVFQQWPIENTP